MCFFILYCIKLSMLVLYSGDIFIIVLRVSFSKRISCIDIIDCVTTFYFAFCKHVVILLTESSVHFKCQMSLQSIVTTNFVNFL